MESEGLDEDAVMMQALDAGAEDFLVEEGVFEIYTAPDDFSTVREALRRKATPSHRPSCRWFRRTTSPLRRKRMLWRR